MNGDTKEKRFGVARKAELNELSNRGTWKVVPYDLVPPDANILEGIFLLATEDEETKV